MSLPNVLRGLGIRHDRDAPDQPCFVCVDQTTGAPCDRAPGPGSPYNLCDRHVRRLVNVGPEAPRWNPRTQFAEQTGSAKRPRFNP
jgi:hypothetical protein